MSHKELLTKLEALLARLEDPKHEVTVGDTKTNQTLVTDFRAILDDSDLPIRAMQKLQRLQSKINDIIQKAYQDN